ncbi:unnamed protein product [Brachionus calyciflorus]|uniref:Aromatic-L-amino-acid decarboxylase n=1 Tax=Brachionus calyciflorus TaxID=104777 RepID=A0A813P1W9_9BILA|nr:unnamed protein product [Brachionus calyciflorus]
MKIATLNVGDINNNSEYLNNLIIDHNIVCIQEHWAVKKDTICQNIYSLDRQIFFSPALKKSKKGRPAGGLAFIVNKDLKCRVKFISHRIGYLKVGNLVIINVYLPFYSGVIEDMTEYDLELAHLDEIISTTTDRVFIMGDFNTDIVKTHHNSIELLKLIKRKNLTIVDIVQIQEIDYTYHKIIKNRVVTSWIDHVICRKIDLNKIKTKIVESSLNIGDHKGISSIIYDIREIQHVKQIDKLKRPKIKWLNNQQILIYRSEIEKQINICGDLTENIYLFLDNNNNDQERLKVMLTEAINKISSIMVGSTTKVMDQIAKFSKGKKKIGQKKYNRWWDSTIKELHKAQIDSFLKYKNSNFNLDEKLMYIEIKRKFRQQKRFNLAIKRNRITHSSFERATLLAPVTCRKLQVDEKYSLRGDTLLSAIEKDKKEGLIPFLVCATLGTTSICSYDNLQELGPVCRDNNIWLHIDAAYAGSAFICPEFRPYLKGVEFSDSFNFNPHKWLQVAFDCSALWIKNRSFLVDSFNVDPVYLKYENQNVAPDFRHWQIPLGRRFRSLKLWFVLRLYGVKGLQNFIRQHVDLAKYFETLVNKDNRFEIVGEVTLGLVCFRLKQSNELNENLLKIITQDKKIYMVPSKINDTYFMRFVICSSNIEKRHIDFAWENILKHTEILLKNSD